MGWGELLAAGDPRVRARVDAAGPLSLTCGAGCCFAGDERGERACDAWGVLAAERVCSEVDAPAISRCDEGRRCFGGEALWGRDCEAAGVLAAVLAWDAEGVSAITRWGGEDESARETGSVEGGVSSTAVAAESSATAPGAAS